MITHLYKRAANPGHALEHSATGTLGGDQCRINILGAEGSRRLSHSFRRSPAGEDRSWGTR
jgi:hypothetical protein